MRRGGNWKDCACVSVMDCGFAVWVRNLFRRALELWWRRPLTGMMQQTDVCCNWKLCFVWIRGCVTERLLELRERRWNLASTSAVRTSSSFFSTAVEAPSLLLVFYSVTNNTIAVPTSNYGKHSPTKATQRTLSQSSYAWQLPRRQNKSHSPIQA